MSLSPWIYQYIQDTGFESLVYKMKNGDTYGIMKIIKDNEYTTTIALRSLSEQYPYYIRVLDLIYISTDIDRESNAMCEYIANDFKEGKYDMVFGVDTCSPICHCIYEVLYHVDDMSQRDDMIIYIHMYIAIHIARDNIGFCSTDIQWMYRPTSTDDTHITIQYDNHIYSIPNIGYIPVIMDHGYSYTDNAREDYSISSIDRYCLECIGIDLSHHGDDILARVDTLLSNL